MDQCRTASVEPRGGASVALPGETCVAVPGQTGLFTDQQPVVGGTTNAVPSDLDILSATHC